MPQHVVMGAMMQCTFGAAPSSLITNSAPTTQSSYMTVATIMDHKPIANIPPFGLCSSLAFPATASATSAALGVLTPTPCVPNTPAPWTPGSPTVQVNNFPALNNTCKLTCIWGGMISITQPGQTTEEIP